jgi:hypothetical protein
MKDSVWFSPATGGGTFYQWLPHQPENQKPFQTGASGL